MAPSDAADEDTERPAFGDLRKRFENLSAAGGAGPSRPSTLAHQRPSIRISSDNLHDRVQAPSPKKPAVSRLGAFQLAPPTSPSALRSRSLSNPDVSGLEEMRKPSRPTTPTPASPRTLAPSAGGTTLFPAVPPRRKSQDVFPAPNLPSVLRKAPPPPPPSSSASVGRRSGNALLIDDSSDSSPAHSVSALRSMYDSTRSGSASSSAVASVSSLLEHKTDSPEEFTSTADPFSNEVALPPFIVRPSGRSNATSPLPPPVPPRPAGSSTGSLTPPQGLPLSLLPSPRSSIRSVTPPPLPSRTSKSLAVPTTDLLTDMPVQPRYYEPNFTQQRGGSEPLLATYPLIDHASNPPPIPARPMHKSSLNDRPPLNGQPPPVLPPRPSLPSLATEPIATVTAPSPSSLPPPLPHRHRPSFDEAVDATHILPRLPPRHHSVSTPTDYEAPHLPPPIPGNRPTPSIGSVHPPPSHPASHILPPPTRIVGRETPVKPKKRLYERSDDSSSSSSGSEDDQGAMAIEENGLKKRVDELPDSTHSSRRLPSFRPGFSVHAPAHVGVVAVAGNCVCVGHHTIKVYDLDSLDTPLHHVELKDLLSDVKLKEHHRITALGFRPAANREDDGRFLWCGMKDGHLFEFDAWTGALCDVRQNAHSGTVTNILRWGPNMVTVDDSGKAFIWSPSEPNTDITLSRGGNAARYIRIPDRQGFVRVFGNQLWTANGPGNNASGSATAMRAPSVRVYDLEATAGAAGPSGAKTLIASDPVGQVICGTILPSRPEKVYLGHEGGVITIWNRDGIDGTGTPNHSGTIKIGTSDVLSLEGVRSRLWAGSRVGIISTYDVETLPWTVTNTWRAHAEYPVLQIEADPYSIGKCARFTVFSVGRDEKVRFWDGFLGIDRIETDLLKRETSFSTFRQIRVLMGSWNIDAAKPEQLSSNAESVSFLADYLRSIGCSETDAPDLIVFGFQEVIDLESRKLTAKNVILGAGKRAGTISDRVSRHYRLWLDALSLAIRTVMPIEVPYSIIHQETLVGLLSCVFVKNSQRSRIRDPHIVTLKRGMKGRYGNKGAIAARFTIDDSSLCFINCHLAAGQKHVRERNHDVASILEEKSVFPAVDAPEIAFVGGGDGSMMLDHELCFLSGDLNYRIDQRREVVVPSINQGDLQFLLQHDQLNREMRLNPAFRLRAFTESPITFIPTYKYDRRSNEFDSSEKHRIPAWCDRILYRCKDPDRIQPLHYRRYEANISDHRPISAGFVVTVKSIQHDLRDAEKEEVEKLWRKEEQELLREAYQFYLAEKRL